MKLSLSYKLNLAAVILFVISMFFDAFEVYGISGDTLENAILISKIARWSALSVAVLSLAVWIKEKLSAPN